MEAKSGIRIVVGLGNPGPQYEKTRHNVGFWLINALIKKYSGAIKLENKFKGLFGVIDVSNHECKVLMPVTFMNLSGESVSKVINFYKIPVESILVVHDELDFPPGVARLKQDGSANSHNGVQNVIDQLGDNNFWRLRIGIGKPAFKGDVDYVTSVPSKPESKQIRDVIDRTLEIFPDLVLGNFSKAMQDLHGDVKN